MYVCMYGNGVVFLKPERILTGEALTEVAGSTYLRTCTSLEHV